ncbi:MAG: energy-coupling factor transporter transmembrane protein EcfT [Propionibacteriaceae bacterium]|nr:energy-coupling factor transporter transmembrane protein EcfT [Propionibacteriaceae bacterium]
MVAQTAGRLVVTNRTRGLHPGAWWAWALGCAVVASRTTNLVLLAVLIAVIAFTVVWSRTDAPWARAFRLYVWLGLLIVVLRLGFRILFGAKGSTVVLWLPQWRLPGVFSAVTLFGPVSAEAVMSALQSGVQLAAMVLAVGAANALANPKRLLAAVPAALYEWGTVVIIALTVFPQLAESVVRVRRARQLRAEAGRGTHLIRTVAMPVLSDGLDRSLLLAGAMDSRGYGRSSLVRPAVRRASSVMILAATLALCVGAYGLLDTGRTPWWMGLPMVVTGLVVAVVGLRWLGLRVKRTRYRPDRFGSREAWMCATAVVSAAAMMVVDVVWPVAAFPAAEPLGWPQVSLVGLGAVLLLLAPVVIAPTPVMAATTVTSAAHATATPSSAVLRPTISTEVGSTDLSSAQRYTALIRAEEAS